MATRLYLRDTTANTAGYVATEMSTVLPVGTGVLSGNAVRDLSQTAGSSQTTDTLGNSLTGHSDLFLRKFISPTLAVSSISAQTWTIALAVSESDAGANAFTVASIYVLTNADTVRGFVYNSDTALGVEWSLTEDGQVYTVSGSAVASVVSTDRLCFEVWAHSASQAMSFNYIRTLYYNGASAVTGATTTDAASYIETPQDGLFVAGPATVERAVAIGGTVDILSAPQRELLRAAAIGGTADVAAAGVKVSAAVERSAALDVTAEISARGADNYEWSESAAATTLAGAATLERAAALDATASVAAVPQSVVIRSAALGATAAVAVAQIRVHPRQAALDAAAAIAIAPQRVVQRAGAFDAGSNIAAAGIEILPRGVEAAGTATITVVGQLIAHRQIGVSLSAGIAVAGAIAGATERQVGLDATASIAAAPQRAILRSAAIDGTAAIASAQTRAVARQAALEASSNILIAGIEILPRGAEATGTAGIFVAGQLVAHRQAALSLSADITARGETLADSTAKPLSMLRRPSQRPAGS